MVGGHRERRNWPESWIADSSNPDSLPEPPLAVEVTLQLEDLGEMRRIYALPPL